MFTLQGINISHLGKRKIIFKMPFLGDMLVSWRVSLYISFITVWAVITSFHMYPPPSAPAYSLGVPWPGNVPPGVETQSFFGCFFPVWRGVIISIYIYMYEYIYIHMYIYTYIYAFCTVIVCVYVFCVA